MTLTGLPAFPQLEALARRPEGAPAPVAGLHFVAIVLPQGSVMCRPCTHTAGQRRRCLSRTPCAPRCLYTSNGAGLGRVAAPSTLGPQTAIHWSKRKAKNLPLPAGPDRQRAGRPHLPSGPPAPCAAPPPAAPAPSAPAAPSAAPAACARAPASSPAAPGGPWNKHTLTFPRTKVVSCAPHTSCFNL